MSNLSYYYGPEYYHPFVKQSISHFEVINPAEIRFNWSGNAWRNTFDLDKLDVSIIDRMGHSTYKNYQDGVLWYTSHPYKGYTATRTKSGGLLMDVTDWCQKGQWEQTKGKTYLESYLDAVLHVYRANPAITGFHIVDFGSTIHGLRKEHEMGSRWIDSYNILNSFFIKNKIPLLITDKDINFNFNMMEKVDLEFLEYEPLSDLVPFIDASGAKLYTRRYKSKSAPKWIAHRFTYNADRIQQARGIAPKSMVKLPALVTPSERKDMRQ